MKSLVRTLEFNFSCSIYFEAVEAELHAEKLLKLHELVHAILTTFIYNKKLKGTVWIELKLSLSEEVQTELKLNLSGA